MRVEILEAINGVHQVSAVTDKPNDQPVRVARYGPKVAIRVDGVWLTGQQKVDGKFLRLKKQADDLLIEADGQPLVQLEGFFVKGDVVLHGEHWRFGEQDGVMLEAGSGVVVSADMALAALPEWFSAPPVALLTLGGVALTAGGSERTSSPEQWLLQAADRNNAAVTHEFYALAGVSGVNAENVGAINSALNTPSVSSQSLQGISGLQQVVDAYNRILAKARHPAENSTPSDPTASDYSTIGADIGAARVDADKLVALNQAVAALTQAHVDSVAEIESLARALNATQSVQEREALVQAWLSLESQLPMPFISTDAFGFH